MVTCAKVVAKGYSQDDLHEAIAKFDRYDVFAKFIVSGGRRHDMLYFSSLIRYSLYRKAAAANEAIVEFEKLKCFLIQMGEYEKSPVAELAKMCNELSGDVLYYYEGRRLIIADENSSRLKKKAKCEDPKDQAFRDQQRKKFQKVRGYVEHVSSNVYQLVCSVQTNCYGLITAGSPCRSDSFVVKAVTRADGKEINYDVSERESDDQSNTTLSIDFLDMDGVSSVYTLTIDKLVAGPGVQFEGVGTE